MSSHQQRPWLAQLMKLPLTSLWKSTATTKNRLQASCSRRSLSRELTLEKPSHQKERLSNLAFKEPIGTKMRAQLIWLRHRTKVLAVTRASELSARDTSGRKEMAWMCQQSMIRTSSTSFTRVDRKRLLYRSTLSRRREARPCRHSSKREVTLSPTFSSPQAVNRSGLDQLL